jgi:OOP family OmpA-OmpF porin
MRVDANGCPPDSDGDGVADDKDQCPNTPAGAEVNEVGCWTIGGVNFDLNKATIRPEARPILDNVVAILKRNTGLKVLLEGHTDSTGSLAYNKGLSERRANAVKDYLVAAGIDPSRLSTVGLGPSQPIADNATSAGRAQNRRVRLQPLP